MGLEFLMGNSENIKRQNDINAGIYTAKAVKGLWIQGGRAPFGYKKEGKNEARRLVVDESEVIVVRYIYDAYIAGVALYKIKEKAIEMGLKRTATTTFESRLINQLKVNGGDIEKRSLDSILFATRVTISKKMYQNNVMDSLWNIYEKLPVSQNDVVKFKGSVHIDPVLVQRCRLLYYFRNQLWEIEPYLGFSTGVPVGLFPPEFPSCKVELFTAMIPIIQQMQDFEMYGGADPSYCTELYNRLNNLLDDLDRCEASINGGPPYNNGGGSPVTPGTPNIPTMPTELQIANQIANKPFALFGNLDCDIVREWLGTAKHEVQQAQIAKLNSVVNNIVYVSIHGIPVYTIQDIAHVQNINDAHSTVVNMDYFPITINQLPVVNGQRLTASQFKEYIRKNINNFVNTVYSKFEPYRWHGINDESLWNSANPLNTMIGIDIAGPDNGTVIVSKHNDMGWTFTTVYDPKYGIHPVSGNRDFGYVQNSDGSYTFYTRGVDRLTDPVVNSIQYLSGLPFSSADALWTSFQNKIANFVNEYQGQATVIAPEIKRPDWQLIKDVLDGKKPLSTLSTDCKD